MDDITPNGVISQEDASATADDDVIGSIRSINRYGRLESAELLLGPAITIL
jgi:hypothetical protein